MFRCNRSGWRPLRPPIHVPREVNELLEQGAWRKPLENQRKSMKINENPRDDDQAMAAGANSLVGHPSSTFARSLDDFHTRLTR